MHDPGLPDWRLLANRLHATYRAADFAAAARFVTTIPDADVDLRAGGVVHISVAEDDGATANAITALAADAGLTADPLARAVTEVAIDAVDIAAVRPFWRAVLGYAEVGRNVLEDPERIGPAFWFQQMDEPRTERNRFHIDVLVPHDVAEVRVEQAIAAGGVLVTDEYARSWWVLADPEGNEACICTWQDRD